VATTQLCHVTGAAGASSQSKYSIEVVYMHTRLTERGVLKYILKKGVSQSKRCETNLL
jgi:hypothetical protein